MKIALLALPGLLLGALGGSALGIGAGLAWVQFLKTSNLQGHGAMLVFFTFMPPGAAIGGFGGALLSGVIAIRELEIALDSGPRVAATVEGTTSSICAMQKCPLNSGRNLVLKAQQRSS